MSNKLTVSIGKALKEISSYCRSFDDKGCEECPIWNEDSSICNFKSMKPSAYFSNYEKQIKEAFDRLRTGVRGGSIDKEVYDSVVKISEYCWKKNCNNCPPLL